MEIIHGNYEKSYMKSLTCAAQIILKNPESVVYVTRKADNTFNGMIVCFEACLHGFVTGCRPLVGLDGCFLKGKFGGGLFGNLCIGWEQWYVPNWCVHMPIRIN